MAHLSRTASRTQILELTSDGIEDRRCHKLVWIGAEAVNEIVVIQHIDLYVQISWSFKDREEAAAHLRNACDSLAERAVTEPSTVVYSMNQLMSNQK